MALAALAALVAPAPAALAAAAAAAAAAAILSAAAQKKNVGRLQRGMCLQSSYHVILRCAQTMFSDTVSKRSTFNDRLMC